MSETNFLKWINQRIEQGNSRYSETRLLAAEFFINISELKEGINNYVDKYNNKRFHSSIGYKKPMDVYLSAFKNAA